MVMVQLHVDFGGYAQQDHTCRILGASGLVTRTGHTGQPHVGRSLSGNRGSSAFPYSSSRAQVEDFDLRP